MATWPWPKYSLRSKRCLRDVATPGPIYGFTHCVLSGADALAEVLRRQFRQPLSLDLRHVTHVEARREEQLVEDDAAHAP